MIPQKRGSKSKINNAQTDDGQTKPIKHNTTAQRTVARNMCPQNNDEWHRRNTILNKS